MSRRRRKHRGNRLGILSISAVVAIMMVSLSVQSNGLKKKLATYEDQVVTLQQQIEAEDARTEEIEELEEYKQTTEYVEEVAKDKLGLVYEDEIIFVPSK